MQQVKLQLVSMLTASPAVQADTKTKTVHEQSTAASHALLASTVIKPNKVQSDHAKYALLVDGLPLLDLVLVLELLRVLPAALASTTQQRLKPPIRALPAAKASTTTWLDKMRLTIVKTAVRVSTIPQLDRLHRRHVKIVHFNIIRPT